MTLPAGAAPSGALPLSPLETDVLKRITPTPQQEEEAQAMARHLVAAVDAQLRKRGVPGRAAVQGSLAKGTWLAGSADVDLFVLLDPSVPASDLERVTQEVGRAVLQDAHTRYAQHPYLIGTFEGRTVDLVPAYAVASAGAKMSAVDRTPFHTAWVRQALSPPQKGDVRLLKRWLKGVGVYGAQTATGGFSGYLAEVLVAVHGSFGGVLAWLAADAMPRRLRVGPDDQVTDEVAPLVAVDPVDPARNCAAAVQAATLATAIRAARAYMARPSAAFFFPASPRAAPATVLHEALARQGATWTAVLLRPRTDRLDIVFPQFQKWARTVAEQAEAAGFPVTRHAVLATGDGQEVLAQWLFADVTKPPTRLHEGPSEDGRPNAQRFREKWTGHADAAGPVHVGDGGNLVVEVRVRDRRPKEWFDRSLGQLPAGRHVMDTLGDAWVGHDPAAAPAPWAPAVADFILDRDPWDVMA